MKVVCLTIALGIAAILPECIHDSRQRITDGVYREPTSIEEITVKGREMTLQLNSIKGSHLGIIRRTYRYEVLTDSKLRFLASSNDSFFVFTILKYEWSWDGKEIVRKHNETGETVVFTRE